MAVLDYWHKPEPRSAAATASVLLGAAEDGDFRILLNCVMMWLLICPREIAKHSRANGSPTEVDRG